MIDQFENNITFETYLDNEIVQLGLESKWLKKSIKINYNLGDASWIIALPHLKLMKEYGWKIHLSATIENCIEILKTALPILLKNEIPFKFPDSLWFLAKMNASDSQPSQAGKFITLYPENDEQAVNIAWKLHEVTKNFCGPRILSDKSLTPTSLVHYRWGGYIEKYAQTLFGEITTVINYKNKIIIDRRSSFYTDHEFISNPFKTPSEQNDSRFIKQKQYLPAYHIDRSIRGDVLLALDTVHKRRCILKSGRTAALVDHHGRDAISRLNNEYKILKRLYNHAAVPVVYDFFKDSQNNCILVLEDVSGKILSDYILENQCHCVFPKQSEIISIAIKIACEINKIHQQGIIHSDLKLANIILTPENEIVIIDFDVAYDTQSPQPPFSFGTIGFSSPQQRAYNTPTVTDDIFSFGALLFYLATNANPTTIGKASNKNPINICLINSSVGKPLENFIMRCLHQEEKDRPQNFSDVIQELSNLKKNNLSISCKSKKLANSTLFLDHAKKIAHYLISTFYSPDKPGVGFAPLTIGNQVLLDLRGTAGCVLALAELVYETSDKDLENILITAADSLLERHAYTILYNKIPGLYVGENGICVALLRAGQVLKNIKYIQEAIISFRNTCKMPHESSDLFNGSAGRLRTALLLWQETQDPAFFNIASNIAKILISKAISAEYCWWILPDTSSLLNEAHYENKSVSIGYSHGAAGIADSLLDYFSVSNNSQAKKIILKTIHWLKKIAQPCGNNSRAIGWPVIADGPITQPFWCHGSAGIGKFLLRANQIDKDTIDIAKRAAYAAVTARSSLPNQCHGLAGNIEFLLDLYQATHDQLYLDASLDLASVLTTWTDNLEHDWSGLSGFSPLDYMSGLPGVIACYLRLANPLTKPTQLSVAGFSQK